MSNWEQLDGTPLRRALRVLESETADNASLDAVIANVTALSDALSVLEDWASDTSDAIADLEARVTALETP